MKPDRRKFFQTFGAGAAGIGLTSALPLSSCASSSERESTNEDDQILFIGDDIAVVETEYGKVKGFILRNIYQFRGIPYGADSGGKNHLMTPPKPEPWTDMYPALWWGNTAPQPMENRYENKYGAFRDHWNYDDVS